MNIQQAEICGHLAYVEGRQMAPALNQAFLRKACASTDGTLGSVNSLLEAYIHGWTVTHLAKDIVDPEMPSVKALMKIVMNVNNV